MIPLCALVAVEGNLLWFFHREKSWDGSPTWLTQRLFAPVRLPGISLMEAGNPSTLWWRCYTYVRRWRSREKTAARLARGPTTLKNIQGVSIGVETLWNRIPTRPPLIYCFYSAFRSTSFSIKYLPWRLRLPWDCDDTLWRREAEWRNQRQRAGRIPHTRAVTRHGVWFHGCNRSYSTQKRSSKQNV